MTQPDILIFMSDQHNARIAGYAGDAVIRTPNLDRIASEGTVFDAAYTSYPLCVPARMSMLTGQLPSRTGIMTNQNCIGSDRATFLHTLVNAGYDAVLCGRMHFMGPDQRHGFTERLVGDFTPIHTSYIAKERKERLGPFWGTLGFPRSLKVVGGGNSPVLEYDRAVVRAARERLGGPREKPQCMVVGTYGPHHTYVAPPDLYRHYKETVPAPATQRTEPNHKHSVLEERYRDLPPEQVRKIRAAYYGMIEEQDRLIGLVYDAWHKQLERTGREGVFVYLSDHGDQVDEHRLYSKQTFFEGSARIPMLFAGAGIARGHRVAAAVNIMDLAPTLNELAGAAPLPDPDGRSLLAALGGADGDTAATSICESYCPDASRVPAYGRMVRCGAWKLISYEGYEQEDLLFDIERDPDELVDLASEHPEKAAELATLAWQDLDRAAVKERYRADTQHRELIKKWNRAVIPPPGEVWTPPADCCREPE